MFSQEAIDSTMDFVEGAFDALRVHYQGPGEGLGMNRLSCSPQEREAHDIFAKLAAQLGMNVYEDAFGNTHAVYGGAKSHAKPILVIGSHLDAVRNGGEYDGPAGVIGGLAAVHLLQAQGIVPEQIVMSSAWIGEESDPFPQAGYGQGSHVATGQANIKMLEAVRADSGLSMRRHLEDVGRDVGAIGKVISGQQHFMDLERIGFYLEGHIEQAPALYRNKMDVGIVPNIRGNIRMPNYIWFAGIPGHTGAMPQSDRRDAGFGAADYALRVEQKLTAIKDEGRDITFSAPDIQVEGPKATTVPQLVRVRLEARSNDPDVLGEVRHIFKHVAEDVAKDRGLCVYTGAPDMKRLKAYRDEGGDAFSSVSLDAFSRQEPVVMDEQALKLLYDGAARLGLNHMNTPSGAGHDAGVMAQAGVQSAMIFFPQKLGRSHRPDEDFDLRQHYMKGVQLMALAAADIAPMVRRSMSWGGDVGDNLMQRGAKLVRLAYT